MSVFVLFYLLLRLEATCKSVAGLEEIRMGWTLHLQLAEGQSALWDGALSLLIPFYPWVKVTVRYSAGIGKL